MVLDPEQEEGEKRVSGGLWISRLGSQRAQHSGAQTQSRQDCRTAHSSRSRRSAAQPLQLSSVAAAVVLVSYVGKAATRAALWEFE